MSATCIGTTKAGNPCTATIGLSDAGLCISHDPERVAEKRAGAAAGGRAPKGDDRLRARMLKPTGLPRKPKTLEQVANYFAWIVDATARRQIDARTSHEMTIALTGYRVSLEKRDVEQKLSEVTAYVRKLKKCDACAAKWAVVEGAP